MSQRGDDDLIHCKHKAGKLGKLDRTQSILVESRDACISYGDPVNVETTNLLVRAGNSWKLFLLNGLRRHFHQSCPQSLPIYDAEHFNYMVRADAHLQRAIDWHFAALAR